MGSAKPQYPPADCLSPLELDEWHVGDTSDERRAAHASHLAECKTCQARLARVRDAADAFLSRYPRLPDLQVMPETTTPAYHKLGRRWPVAVATLAALAAAAIMLIFSPPVPTPGHRTKGAPHLGVYVQRDGVVFKLGPKDAVRPGDRLRFEYTMVQDGYLSIWGTDAGELVHYHPAAGDRALRTSRGNSVALDFAIELDAGPGPEAFFGVFCEAPVRLARVRAALPPGTKEALPSGCAVDVLKLPKDPAR